MNMKQCAIILNGSDVVKVANLKRKYNKLVNNPEIKILEECDEDSLEERYSYWNLKYKKGIQWRACIIWHWKLLP